MNDCHCDVTHTCRACLRRAWQVANPGVQPTPWDEPAQATRRLTDAALLARFTLVEQSRLRDLRAQYWLGWLTEGRAI